MQLASLLSSGWPSVLSALPSSLDLTALARSEGAIKRSRRVSDGETLLRLALWYGPCGLSLRSAAALAAGTETANLSDVALLKRLSGAADWLEAIVATVLAERHSEPMTGTRDLVLIDGTAISQPGSKSTDWVLHSRYKPGHGFSGFTLTDRSGGEALDRHTFSAGEIVIADRAYARGGKGLSHVRNQQADFIVRAGWRSLALRDEYGQPLDLLARLKGLAPGEIERVFEKFYRGTAGSVSGRGTGLGLSICRAIIDAHGGKIWAQNRSPDTAGRTGASFKFSLPIEGVPPTVPSFSPEPESSNG